MCLVTALTLAIVILTYAVTIVIYSSETASLKYVI